MCNQVLLQFLIVHFETMRTCCGYIEDVHMNFCRQKKKKKFDKITAFSTRQFQVSLQRRVASLCNQLLPGFASNQFETLHICYKHIEDVHVILASKKIVIQGGHALWKTGKMVKKNSLQGKIREFKKILSL